MGFGYDVIYVYAATPDEVYIHVWRAIWQIEVAEWVQYCLRNLTNFQLKLCCA